MSFHCLSVLRYKIGKPLSYEYRLHSYKQNINKLIKTYLKDAHSGPKVGFLLEIVKK